MRRHDAVVIGAGPAGSMAAGVIARAGFDVLLVEKQKSPGRLLACAEGISAGALKDLIDDYDPSWICNIIDRIKIASPDGNSVIAKSESRGMILNRSKFDYDLAMRAQNHGAHLVCNTIAFDIKKINKRFATIDLMKPDRSIDTVMADIFISAEGVMAQIPRQGGLKNALKMKNVMAALQYRVQGIDIEPDMIELYLGRDVAPGGYIWVFPKSKNSANVGICIVPDKHDGSEMAEYLEKFIDKRFGRAKIESRHCGLIPTYSGDKTMQKNNLLVVGDAARIIESLSGAGIAMGMYSGKYAGSAAVEYLSKTNRSIKDLKQEYPGRFLKDKKEELIRFAKMRRAFVHMTDNDFNYIIDTLKGIIDNNNGSGMNAGRLLWTILTTHPKLLRLARYLV